MSDGNSQHRRAGSPTRGARGSGPLPRRISNDPLINWLHRSLPELFLVAYLGLIAYCSLLPFGTTSCPHGLSGCLDWSGMTSRSAGLKDILPNILLYAPLGAGSYIVARRAHWGRVAALVAGMTLATGSSLVLELLQQLTPLRVSSWVDVVSNMAGGLVGAMMGRTSHALVSDMLRHGRLELREMPLATAVRAYAIVLILAGLIPLDFTYDLSRIGRAVGQANLRPFSQLADWRPQVERAGYIADAADSVTLRRVKVDFWLDMVAEAAAFGLLAILMAASFRREYYAGRLESWLYATLYTTLIAAGLSILQFFILSRGLDATAAVVRSLAALLSAGASVWLLGGRRGSPRQDSEAEPRTGRRRVVRLLAAGVVAYIVCRGLSPLVLVPDRVSDPDVWGRIGWLPMAGYFHSRIPASTSDVLHKVLRYGVFGVLTALALGLDTRGSYRRRAWRIAACAAGLAAVVEVCQIYLPTRWPDLTHVLLAGLGSYAGAVGARWLRDYDRAVCRPQPAAFETADHAAPPSSASSVLNVPIPPPDEPALKSGDSCQSPRRLDP